MDYSINGEKIKYFRDKIKYFIIPSEGNNYRCKFLESNLLLYFVVLILALKLITFVGYIKLPQNIFFADITKSALENFANQTRQSAGLAPLTENQKLNQAAQLKAENMLQNNYFAHTSPTGLTPWYWFLQAGYNYKYAGENLAIGFFNSQEVYQAWLNSPSHKENILNPNYKEVGTAVLSGFGSNNTIIVVQEFGSQQAVRALAKPVAVNNKKQTVTPAKEAPVAQSNPPAVTGEKVLSQSTEAQNIIGVSTNGSANPYNRVMNYILYNYAGLLQNIVYAISLIVIGTLSALIFFSNNIEFKQHLVFRSFLIMVLLSIATLLSKELISLVIPHQIII
jgi:uncharacterized protein YkwD